MFFNYGSLKLKLTLCITTYNRCAYLEELLQTIRAQTFKDFHIIILDNASSQDYQGMLKRFNDLDIEHIRHEKNIGPVKNGFLAFGFHFRSPYHIVFHDDDLMHPRFLEWEIQILEENQKVLFVASIFQGFQDGQTPPFHLWENASGRYEIYDDVSQIARVLLQGAPLHFGSVMYRSSALDGAEFDNVRFSNIADRPFLIEIARKGSCALIHDPMVLYRMHPSQDSKTDVLTEDNVIELNVNYRNCFPDNWDEADRNLFLWNSTNNLLDSYNRLSGNKRSNLWEFIKKCRDRGVMDFRFLDTLGMKAIHQALINWQDQL